MVGAEDVGMDLRIVKTLAQTVGDDEVIDAPAGILLTGLEAVRPPGILHFIRIFLAEGVGKAVGQQMTELGALLVGKARIMTVGLGILDIDLLMGHIQVTTETDGFPDIQSLEVGQKSILPRHAIIETFQTIL